ncbi:thioredoxin [Gimesia benthica]|uniref:Thioredoxin n=1 Tax=Gimesia benthica TaxID=2608982 RepID=A0A6I6A8M4_9PLAN|nr:thioredoxin [Gimesia benthica]QGQ22804.1 thioredoxin [Gimesia benthica]
MSANAPWIIDVTEENFETEVLQKSQQIPIIIDFWAPWCGPCQQLAPMLENVLNEFQGKVQLAKINIDEQQGLAAAFRVQSIPTVVAFLNGQPVDHFQGILPEESLREWVTQLVPSPIDMLLQEGQILEETDPAAAEGKYREAAELDPKNDTIKLRLAAVLVKLSRFDECGQIIEELETRGFLEPEAEQIKSQLELQAAADEAGGVEEARKALEADPDNADLKIALADALAISNKHEEALEICLVIIAEDKAGAGVEAKATMLRIFDLLGPQSALTSAYRRKLATLLY